MYEYSLILLSYQKIRLTYDNKHVANDYDDHHDGHHDGQYHNLHCAVNIDIDIDIDIDILFFSLSVSDLSWQVDQSQSRYLKGSQK